MSEDRAASLRGAMWVLLGVSTLTIMAGATISPSLPGLQTEFAKVNNVELLVRLVLTVPALSIAVCAPLAGLLIDRVGRLRVLVPAVMLYGLAGGSGLVLGNLYAILVGRALLGLAVAAIMVTATALISDYWEGEERARILGYQAAFMGFGGTVFLAVGGFLADVDVRGPFAVYLAALALTPFVARVLHEPTGNAAAGDRDGEEQGDVGSQQGRSVQSLFPWRLVALVYTLAFLGMVVFYAIPTQLPFHLEALSGAGPTTSGLAIALVTLVGAVVSLNFRRLRARLGFGMLAIATFVLLGAGFLLLGAAQGLGLVTVGLVVVGGGTGLLMPTVNSWISAGTPTVVLGTALGGLSSALFLGQFFSPVLTQPLVGSGAARSVFLLGGALALVIAMLVGLLLLAIRRAQSQATRTTSTDMNGRDGEGPTSPTTGPSVFC